VSDLIHRLRRLRYASGMSEPDLTLSGDFFWISPYFFTVFVALREKGLPFRVEEVALHEKAQLGEAYRRTSPTGRVPALTHGDFSLAESSAIVDYLEDVFPSPGHPRVLPASARERGLARMLLAWIRSDETLPLRHERGTSTMFYEPTRAPLSVDGQRSLTRLLSLVDRLLTPGAPHLFATWSIADADLAFFLHRLLLNGDELPPAVAAYAAAQWQRPSVQAFVTRARPAYVPY
jgi:glutathione S-transferase